MKSQLHLLPSTNTVTALQVLSVASAGRLYACDFAVTGAQDFDETPWGYQQGRLVNIDHHAPVARMRRQVSSANLALLCVQQQGIAQAGDTVVINHTDCDSILSSAILRGDVEPLEVFGTAAIAADHTGEQNVIADLLQGLDKWRDHEFSLRNLQLLLQGRSLDDEAQGALAVRHRKRDKASELVQSGAFTLQDGLAWAVLEDSIDGEFFPALLPHATLIVMFSPREDDSGKWNAKFRLGFAAPVDFSVAQTIAPLDAGYGGRWNAGSNKRAGGSDRSPRDYAAAIVEGMSRRDFA